MTSDNVTEAEPVKAAEPQPAKKVDDRLIDELVGHAQAEGLQLTGEGGLPPAADQAASGVRPGSPHRRSASSRGASTPCEHGALSF